jgi:hypothetical protein
LDQGKKPKTPGHGKGEGSFRVTNKDAFDLWWEWATKPQESMLSIDGDIHYPIMELSGRSARPKEGQRSCAPIPGKSQLQHLNRIGRRIILWMLPIAALAVIWNLLDERGRQLLSQCQVEAKSRWRVISR